MHQFLCFFFVINRKIELYEMGWNLKDGLRDCLIAAAPYGGPIGKSQKKGAGFLLCFCFVALTSLICLWVCLCIATRLLIDSSCLLMHPDFFFFVDIFVAYTLNFQTFSQVMSALLSYVCA